MENNRDKCWVLSKTYEDGSAEQVVIKAKTSDQVGQWIKANFNQLVPEYISALVSIESHQTEKSSLADKINNRLDQEFDNGFLNHIRGWEEAWMFNTATNSYTDPKMKSVVQIIKEEFLALTDSQLVDDFYICKDYLTVRINGPIDLVDVEAENKRKRDEYCLTHPTMRLTPSFDVQATLNELDRKRQRHS